jgi:hypothetical protein
MIGPQAEPKRPRTFAYQIGHFFAAMTSIATLAIVSWVERGLHVPLPGFIQFGITMSVPTAVAVWAGRKHGNFRVAVLAPLLASPLGAMGAAALAEACFPEPDDEISADAVIFVLAPVFGLVIWFFAAVAGVITVRVKRGRWQLRRAGHCQECDYDLAGLTGDQCPECGAACGGLK